ncbi:hypothetical protein Lal_00023692 [Lupinus albus]|uniref:VQ domain-containing protein n=1 Tax=Lupinus albus TaxID=3870 RepID=A0A6A4PHW5_LUPAL|nr:hypothetical protein Lalb_Chr13g0293851 [Lupinus albus]KAF1887685.1 hypothetical protein Lal_00023692 [Lupinus albus]
MTSSAPKIVHIETQYVETDAINFKDVVQRLTGKNSSTAWIGNGGFVEGSGVKGGTLERDSVGDKTKEGATFVVKENNSLASSMILLKNKTYKEFDGLLSDLPLLEELLRF